MATAFQLTPAQARKLGISTEEKRTSKPRRRLTPEEKQVQQRVKQAEQFVQRITRYCQNLGWKIGLCRLPSDEIQNSEYSNIKDYEAVPNCVMAWRDCAEYANPRTMFLLWIWEIEGMNTDQLVERLRKLEVAA